VPSPEEIPEAGDEQEEDDDDRLDQNRYDQIGDFTATPPYKVGLDPDSYPYDFDFPFPEDDGDPGTSKWCVWEGTPDPNEDSGVLWEPLKPYRLTRAAAETKADELQAGHSPA